MEEKRLCLECGETIKGRVDKKFCDDMCRNAYNNRLRRAEDKNLLLVNRILLHNYRILSKVSNHHDAVVEKRILEEANFNFNYCTAVSHGPFKKPVYRCYDYIYTIGRHVSINVINE